MELDFAELEREMARQIESGLRPSIQVAVDFKGELVFERAHGDAATVDSTYLLWSSTKPLVAIALLQLVEEGRAALDDRVAKHFPEFGVRGKERCTLLHLLTHRGGFPGTTPALESALSKVARDWNAALRFICEMDAIWEPGTDRGYHPRTGWFVVGELLQRLDGIAFQQLLCGKDAQFEPELPFVTRFTGLRETGCLAPGGGKVSVAQTAPASFAKDELLAMFG